jgi:hypothetical protein
VETTGFLGRESDVELVVLGSIIYGFVWLGFLRCYFF